MDLREKKTRRSIKQAFLTLRRKKALERITVTELSKLAEISKATFYLHYKDIYDLSEQLQEEVIRNILSGIAAQSISPADRYAFTKAMFLAFHAAQKEIETLFSGTQNAVLPMRIETEIKAFFKQQYPELPKQSEMLLTYSIYGSSYVYERYKNHCGMEELIELVSRADPFVLPS